MLFFSSAQSGLIQWCRSFRYGLSAGLSLVRVFQLQAAKGPSKLRGLAGRIALELEKGSSLEDALKKNGQSLPILFHQLATVGEQTGHLPEIFGELADYYELQRKLRRDFISQITWPVIQFSGAVFVIALLIYILGLIPPPGGEPIAPIGFGLRGTAGAITFLIAVSVFLGSVFAAYFVFTRGVRGRAAFEALLLRVPAVGPCASAFALGRFCLALRMTLETGMKTDQALRQSLRATGNTAFSKEEDYVAARIKAGDEIHESLRQCPAVPSEFLEILEVAEVSGQIPETMIRQGEHYREEAARRLQTLGRLAGWCVYAFVALLIIWAISRLASLYFGMFGKV